MYAVEFESKINNGILKIPSKYKRIAESDKVKVIILVENEKEKKLMHRSIFDNFLNMSKSVDEMKIYDRDSLHER